MDFKKYLVIVLVLLSVVVGAALLSGKSNLTQGPGNTGKLAFYVTDPPITPPAHLRNVTETPIATASPTSKAGGPQTVKSLVLIINKVQVHLAYLGVPGPSETPNPTKTVDRWETLAVPSNTSVDLVALAQSHTFSQLGITDLAAGRYTHVRLYLTSAKATLMDGTTVDLRILGQDNIVQVVQTFTVDSGKTTKLTMDFDAQHSVIKADGTYILRPVVAKLVEER